MILKYSGFHGFPHSSSDGASKQLPMLMPRPRRSFISNAGSLSCAIAVNVQTTTSISIRTFVHFDMVIVLTIQLIIIKIAIFERPREPKYLNSFGFRLGL